MKKLKHFLLLLIIIAIVWVPFTFAQNNQQKTGLNITVSPIYFNLTTNPGEKISSQLKVRNNNPTTEHLQVNLAKFAPTSVANEGYQPIIQEITPDDEFAKWISFDTDDFVLGPNQVKTIKFTISPPKSAALGYYYAILINKVGDTQAVKRGALIKAAVAVSILVDVRSPNAIKRLQLVDFTTNNAFYEYLPVNFNIRIKNTGNIHSIPVGNIFIDRNGTGQKLIANMTVNDGRGSVLPQTDRIYTNTWDDGFIVRVPKVENNKTVQDKKGNTVYVTKWNLSKFDRFRIGKYTAELLLVYDDGTRDVPLEARVSFWVIPWKIILAVLVIVYLIYVGIKATIVSNFRKLKKVRS